MADISRHLIGFLLGTEEDWPEAFEAILRRAGPVETSDGVRHEFATQRLRIAPFDLLDAVEPDLVIDRLSYWYYHPREWLKKAALVDGTYLLNSPFTFQAMEKHSAYCAMLRLGLKVPRTVLVPYKNPIDNPRWETTAARYNDPFDLEAIGAELGYPLYMKPFDGGGWRGVSRVENPEQLHAAYDSSEQMLMHLQATIDYESFARALTIGAESMVMDFRPELPMHERYQVNHGFLSPSAGNEVVTISRLVNAFFGWEFNSAEMLVAGHQVHPIDYANATPDIALTSLHYYFPWALTALVRWSLYCLVTGRRTRIDLNTQEFFDIADDASLTYEDKLERYRRLADDYTDTERYWQWCAEHLPDLPARVLDWVASPEFDDLLLRTVEATYPAHEQERFVAHFRGLIGQWVAERTD